MNTIHRLFPITFSYRSLQPAAAILLLLSITFTISACGEEDERTVEEIAPEAQSEVSGEEMPPETIPEGAIDPLVVEVGLDEYDITMPDSLPAGLTDFLITNYGSDSHSFVIEGEGIVARLEADEIEITNTQQMRVDLRPGTYTAYCPLEDHTDLGMTKQFTVVPAGDMQMNP